MGASPASMRSGLTKKSGIWSYSKLQDHFGQAVASIGIERGLKGSRAAHAELKELGRIITAAAAEAEPLEVSIPSTPERKTVTQRIAGLLNKDRSETDGEYYGRIFKWLQGVSAETVRRANHRIGRLVEALRVVNHQLEQERERTSAYQKLAPDPQALADKVFEISKREAVVASKEASVDERVELITAEHGKALEEAHTTLELSKAANAALTLENKNLKSQLATYSR
jgi:hypothetical protein